LYCHFATNQAADLAFLLNEKFGLITTWKTALSSLFNHPNTFEKLLIGSSSKYLKVFIG
jgi:hypothetical protein